MSSVNNMMKSGKKILGISSSWSVYLSHSRIHNNNVGMGSPIIIKKNFSAASESTTPQTQEKADQADMFSDQKNKLIKDAAANLFAYSLLSSIGKNNASPPPPPPPSPSPSPTLQDLLDVQKKPFTSKDNFKFMFDDTGMHLTLNVSNLGKEHLRVFITDNTVLVSSTMKVAATGKVLWEIIELPQLCIYDPDQVTGHIIEGGALKVSFPYSKQEKEHPPWFQVNLV